MIFTKDEYIKFSESLAQVNLYAIFESVKGKKIEFRDIVLFSQDKIQWLRSNMGPNGYNYKYTTKTVIIDDTCRWIYEPLIFKIYFKDISDAVTFRMSI